MENKLTFFVAALSLLVALTDAAPSTMSCTPSESTTFPVGRQVVCTCAASSGTAASTVWQYGGATVTAGTSGTGSTVYTHVIVAGDNGKTITCLVTVGSTPDTAAASVILKAEDPVKPDIKCAPAKVAKNAESMCTCTNKNTVVYTPTKYTFSVDARPGVDGTEGTLKNGLKVKAMMAKTKVTCSVHFSATVKTPASSYAMIETSGGNSVSGLQAVSLAVMIFSFIVTHFVSE
ncbi:uncharacterized protein LOC135498367 [Lineus longissimus]|uniref:uncharacterized protein LOC135498367 n=1 Tax=Lineus longissimus TaxID=88925 RepID=UPI002B4DF396